MIRIRRNLVRRFLLLVALTSVILAACTPPPGGGNPPALRVGLLASQNAAADTEFGALLASALDRDVEVVTAGGGDALYASLTAGDVDVALLSPMLVVRALDEAGATALAIAVRNGSTTYRSQISVRCDAGIDDLAGLVGSRFGFVSAGSNSGHQVPFVMLLQAGIDPDEDLVTSFVGSHDGVVQAIYDDAVDAGASFVDARGTIVADHPDVYEVVCVLAVSEGIPNEAFVVHADVDAGLAAEIGAVLVGIGADAGWSDALASRFNATDFGPVHDDAFDITRDVMAVF